MKVTERRSSVGEWGDEFFEHIIGTDDEGNDFEIIFSPSMAVERGDQEEVVLIFGGAFDFEGSIKEAIERYPDLKETLEAR